MSKRHPAIFNLLSTLAMGFFIIFCLVTIGAFIVFKYVRFSGFGTPENGFWSMDWAQYGILAIVFLVLSVIFYLKSDKGE